MEYNFKEDLHSKLTLLENTLDRELSFKPSPYDRVWEAMRYSALDGGKRIRGLLVIAMGQALGSSIDKLLPVAAAVEMVHAYSLIHDDLPCMDDDDLRRGKPSCHRQFDEATAVLAGDGLLTHSFKTIMTADLTDLQKVIIATTLSDSAGANGMIGGQCIDIANEGVSISEDLLNLLHSLKTGALITASCTMGGMVASANEKQLQAIEHYGKALGLAFQIQDDILDVISNEETLGKPIGSDELNNKTTYITLYGIDKAREIHNELFDNGIKTLDECGINTPFIKGLTEKIRNRLY